MFEEYLRQLLLYTKEIESRKESGETKQAFRSCLKSYRKKYFKHISQLSRDGGDFELFIDSMVSLDRMLIRAEGIKLARLQKIFPADLAQVNFELPRLAVTPSRLPYLKSVMLRCRPISPTEHMFPEEARVFEGISPFRASVLGVLKDKHYEVRP